jgi:hypothetical protein
MAKRRRRGWCHYLWRVCVCVSVCVCGGGGRVGGDAFLLTLHPSVNTTNANHLKTRELTNIYMESQFQSAETVKNIRLHAQARPEHTIWDGRVEILYWLLDYLLQSFQADNLLWTYANGFHVDKVLENGFLVLYGYMYDAEMREIV